MQNELIYKTETDMQVLGDKPWLLGVVWGTRGMGEGIVRELRIDMCALRYLKWIAHKTYCRAREFCSVLCGSLAGRGVWGRVDTCVHVWLSRSAVHLRLSHC